MRLLRYLGCGRNDMRRRSDRVESLIAGALLLVLLLTVPVSAAIALGSYQRDIDSANHSSSTGGWTTAVLIRNAPFASALNQTVEAKAWWTTPDGIRYVGLVDARPGQKAGQKVRIWLSDDASPAAPPPNKGTIVANAVALGLLIVIISAGFLEAARRLVRWRLDRCRLAAWDTEWARVEPGWTGHPKGTT